MMSLLLAAALANGEVLHDFSREDAREFSTVNDTVMGGRSASRIEALEGGVLRFAGELSLENNGGFTSFRSRTVDYGIGPSDGLAIRVKGDGRTYIFSLDISGVPIPAGGYWQEFETQEGLWEDIRLPYADFIPNSFGRQLGGLPAVTPERIDGMALYLSDKKPGSFSIDIDEIGTYWDDASVTVSDDDAEALLPAECSTLLALLEQTGLDAAVSELEGFTLFAPTDDAFAKLPPDVVGALLRPENAAVLERVLLRHVVAAPVTAWNAAGLDRAEVLDGGVLKIERDGSGLRVGGARVLVADRLRGQGVVHVIDSVIVPDDLALVTPAKDASDVLSAAITRGVPLFNDGNAEACAAVYRTAVEATLALSSGSLSVETLETLRVALARSEREDARAAAWTLRGAMDRAITRG